MRESRPRQTGGRLNSHDIRGPGDCSGFSFSHQTNFNPAKKLKFFSVRPIELKTWFNNCALVISRVYVKSSRRGGLFRSGAVSYERGRRLRAPGLIDKRNSGSYANMRPVSVQLIELTG